jgi:hypothetical protein
MTLWLTMNSLGLAIIAAVLYLTLRQIGFVLHRIGTSGARGTDDGPRIGENLNTHLPPNLVATSKAKLLVFVSRQCSICEEIRQAADALAQSWNRDADIILIYDCDASQRTQAVSQLRIGLYMGTDCAMRNSLGATFVPFAIAANTHGTVVGKGLVNEISHLESLLELERETRAASQAEVTIEQKPGRTYAVE